MCLISKLTHRQLKYVTPADMQRRMISKPRQAHPPTYRQIYLEPLIKTPLGARPTSGQGPTRVRE